MQSVDTQSVGAQNGYTLRPYQQALVDGAHDKFASGSRAVLVVSPAGSGKSVVIAEIARRVAQNGRVLFLVHRRELVEQITATFEHGGVDMSQCTIAMVNTLVHHLDEEPEPALIITDESHHALAKTYTTIYEHWPNVRRLGFTATPWRLNGQGLGDVYDSMVEAPSVAWLIEHHFLAPYRLLAPDCLVDTAKLKKRAGDYTRGSIDDAMAGAVFGDIVRTYQDNTPGEQAIVYAHSVEASKRTCEAFNAAGVQACHLDGKTPAKVREDVIQKFRDGEVTVLCNSDIISEGFDVPECTVVILARPTASLVLYIQQAMRCMRYKEGKRATIIDHVGNYRRFGLPDEPRVWTLDNRKHKANTSDPDAIYVCDECLGVFRAWVDDKCPYCGADKPAELVAKERREKEAIEAEMIEVNRMQAEASRDPAAEKSLLGLYKIYEARKKTGVGNVKYPLFAAIHQHLGAFKTDEVKALAAYAGWSERYIWGAINRASKK